MKDLELTVAKILSVSCSLAISISPFAYKSTGNILLDLILCLAAASLGLGVAFCLILLVRIVKKIENKY